MSGRQDRIEAECEAAVAAGNGAVSRPAHGRTGTLIEAFLPPVLAEFELIQVNCEESAEPSSNP